MSSELQLNDAWTFHLQGFGPWELTAVAHLATAQEFWQIMHHTPVNLLFVTTEGPRVAQADPIGNVRSVFLFRKHHENVEFGKNNLSVVYRYEVKNMSPEELDFEWEEVMLSAIGESCNATSWGLEGVRVLDRTKKKQVAYRFELWCSKKAEDVHAFATARAGALGHVYK